MNVNTKKLKRNIPFFTFCASLLFLLVVISTIFDGSNIKLSKVALTNDEVEISKLVINEVMSKNKGVITDPEGNVYDYVELYNGSEKDINLKNYGLSDEAEIKWVFPDVTIEAKSYLVVFLSGKSERGLYAPFKLKSAGGENLGLFKPNGKGADAVTTVALDSNQVMARDEKGNWVIQEKPTPGFANTIDGHEDFLSSLMSKDAETIIISEILPENKGNFKNENGEYSGYIEIKNVSDKTINVANYSLSNEEDVSFKWQLPSVSLASGEVLGIYTSGTSNKSNVLSTSFKLKSKNGVAILTNNKGKVLSKVEYKNLANGVSLSLENGNYVNTSNLSFGYDNTLDGIKNFQKKYLKVNDGLIISEAMNSNYKYLPQNGGNYYDWIELYNNSSKDIELNDYCLTTNMNTNCMYKLPKVTLKSGNYYVVMASGDENLSTSKYKHTNFKLSDVEAIYLTKSNDVIDSLLINDVPKGYSIGKGSKYGVYYYSSPTPNKENGNGSIARSSTPISSKSSGLYDDVKSVKVSLSGPGKIYYTLDGSTPTTSSKVYSSPLTIKKTTVLKIMSVESGKIYSNIKTYSYIINEGHTLPVMSISIDKNKFMNVNNHTALNSNVIEQAYVQFLEQDGSGFELGAGLKLFGGSTRSYRKKSYEIKFKKEFGDAHLKYNVFDTVDSSIYESLVLRTGSQDEFQWSKRILIRDIIGTSLVDEYTDVDVQAYKPIVLYINGEYWGLYFLREKVDENFISNHYNVKATEKNTDIIRIDGEVKSGSNKKYNTMINWIGNNSLSNKNNYKTIEKQIDIKNLCDFWIAETWISNYDIVNTRFFSNPDVDGGKWKFIFYDLDSAFYNVDVNYYTYYTNPSGIGYGNFSTFLLRNLMNSSEFKKTYLERLSYNLKNTWSSKNVINKIDSVVKEIGTDEIKRNLSRWKVCSYNDWQNNINYVKNFAKKRNSYMVSQAKSYFNLSNSEVKKYFGDVK